MGCRPGHGGGTGGKHSEGQGLGLTRTGRDLPGAGKQCRSSDRSSTPVPPLMPCGEQGGLPLLGGSRSGASAGGTRWPQGGDGPSETPPAPLEASPAARLRGGPAPGRPFPQPPPVPGPQPSPSRPTGPLRPWTRRPLTPLPPEAAAGPPGPPAGPAPPPRSAQARSHCLPGVVVRPPTHMRLQCPAGAARGGRRRRGRVRRRGTRPRRGAGLPGPRGQSPVPAASVRC